MSKEKLVEDLMQVDQWRGKFNLGAEYVCDAVVDHMPITSIKRGDIYGRGFQLIDQMWLRSKNGFVIVPKFPIAHERFNTDVRSYIAEDIAYFDLISSALRRGADDYSHIIHETNQRYDFEEEK